MLGLARLLEEERLRLDAPRAAHAPPVLLLNLYDDADVLAAVGLPRNQLFWPPVSSRDVVDRQSAARFCIDVLRARAELRRQFPLALSAPQESGFLDWLGSAAGQTDLELDEGAYKHLVSILSEDFSAPARQLFLANNEIREVFPHGLTPVGQRSLLRWFFRHVLDEGGLGREQIWWLFLEAAEQPQRELIRAYLFTAEWQRRFPDALSMFGWHRFGHWFESTYGLSEAWSEASLPPQLLSAAQQLRIAYRANVGWQAAHPQALSDPAAAKALLEWLMSTERIAGGTALAHLWCKTLDVDVVVPSLVDGGVNIIGHFCYPSGLRVSVEAMTRAIEMAGIETSLRDVRTDARDDPYHASFDGLEVGDVTIIHVQPEPFFVRAYERADLAEREPRTYRVAYWYWEFDSIPESWREQAQQVDEVWTATEFVARGLQSRLHVPVRTLFPGVALAPFQARERTYFGLEANRFTFLFTFHMVSVMERKNPLGLIRAFKSAFRPDEPVTLVLKTSFGDRHPAEFKELCDAAADMPSITVIDEVFSPEDVLSLMNACDAYVSLHRSEGLGLTMAEAMLMGKPVIATAFSGNMDFMDEDNSLLVSYERVKVGKPIPPYDADLEWAEPSVEHAAQLMRRLYEDRAFARDIGARAKKSAEINLSLATAGHRIAERLSEIKRSLRSRQ